MVSTAGFLVYGMFKNMAFFIYGMFNSMGFLIHGFLSRFFCPGSTVKLYFSVLAVLYTVFSLPKTLAKNPGQKSGRQSGQKSGKKSGHADIVLKTRLYAHMEIVV